jgi:hypothetical protein
VTLSVTNAPSTLLLGHTCHPTIARPLARSAHSPTTRYTPPQRLNINYYVARSFYHVCSPLVGIRLDVEGMEHLSSLATAREGKGQSAVLLGNHQRSVRML